MNLASRSQMVQKYYILFLLQQITYLDNVITGTKLIVCANLVGLTELSSFLNRTTKHG